jgi:hypothetical protein
MDYSLGCMPEEGRNLLYESDDDDVYLKKIITRGITKYHPIQKCRPAKGISKRVSIPGKSQWRLLWTV